VAHKSFKLKKVERFADSAEKAYAMNPNNPEYRIFAGLAAFRKKDMDRTIALLEGAAARYPELELYRLTALERACAGKDAKKAEAYAALKKTLLDTHGAAEYYEASLLPLVEALEKTE